MTPNTQWNDTEETLSFGKTVRDFLDKKIDAERFMAFRLQHGVYGQRQDNVHMVRVKVPGGRLSAEQLATFGRILSKYCATTHASITTRQDIQFHFIKLEHTPKVLELLNESGLTTREACGNTVRNITVCSLSGICPQQYTDISPYAEATAQHFLRHPLTQHLPRKFKISFSACPNDCAMGLMHDVGVVASEKKGNFGFKLLAGGGLGHKPRQAIVIAEHLEVNQLIPAIEALITLHNRHSDRKRRAKARIKFLIEKFGVENFRIKFNKELSRTFLALNNLHPITTPWHKPDTLEHSFQDGAPRAIMAQKQEGLSVVPIQLTLGQINAEQLAGLHQLMQEYKLTELRTSSDQNLMLVDVPTSKTNAIIKRLGILSLHTPSPGDNIVACPGTSTCRLGITASRTAAHTLTNPANLRIRISGCHNSCGQHHVGDIGLHGEGKRVQGKLIPSYVIHLGGRGTNNGQIALKAATLPARHVKEAVARISHAFLQTSPAASFATWAKNKTPAYFETLLADLINIAPENIKELARDLGKTERFSVLQLGGGECAGAAQDYVASNFSEALHEYNYCTAFFLQNKINDALECARQSILLTASSILFLAGAKTDQTLQTVLSAFNKVLSHHDKLNTQLAALCLSIEDIEKTSNTRNFKGLLSGLQQWFNAAALACQDMDAQLNLSISEEKTPTAQNTESNIEFDLSSYECPLHYVKARNELRKLPAGQRVKLILEDQEAARQVSLSLKKEGHAILGSEPAGNHIALMVERKQ